MKSVIKVSKTVDEAIEQALIELETTRENVSIDVIQEASRGFLGLIGAKDAKVRVTLDFDPVEIADAFLTKVLSSMDIRGVNLIKREKENLFIDITNIDSNDMGIVIGKRGSTLDAIQYLLSLAINKGNDDYIRVNLDTQGYRAKREETLRRLAQRMADKTKNSSRPVKLEPMNPYERRIIHSAVQDIDGVITYSEGEEPYRRVVIKSK